MTGTSRASDSSRDTTAVVDARPTVVSAAGRVAVVTRRRHARDSR